jgi:pimeloyl-ACP methyl ester carboxylesterase
MIRPPRRRTAIAVLAGAVLLTGCGAPFPGSTAGKAEPTETTEPDLSAYFDQSIDWTPCKNGAECATVAAPLDWEHPSPETDIQLAMARHGALDGDPQGSLFMNPGGPGISGVEYVSLYPEYVVDEELRRAFDLVSWDPRGVGSSSAVDCYSDRELDTFLFDVPESVPYSPEWVGEMERWGADFANACADNTGDLLGFIDTVSTARDLDLLRALVGDTHLNYFGFSYGTLIGALYADLFPENVGRMALDGVADPSADVFEQVVNQMKGKDRALRSYLEGCVADGCPFTGDADVDIAAIAELYQELDRSPLAHADGRLLNSGALDLAMSFSLYEEDWWPDITAMFLEVEAGETKTAFEMVDLYFGRQADGTYLDNSAESLYAISCVDYRTETDPAVLQRRVEELDQITPLVTWDYSFPDPICSKWAYPPRDRVKPVTGKGAPPILVIGSVGDPATPYEGAVAVAEQLESGVLISANRVDHIAYDEADPCINDPVNSYFLTGEAPKADVKCGF